MRRQFEPASRPGPYNNYAHGPSPPPNRPFHYQPQQHPPQLPQQLPRPSNNPDLTSSLYFFAIGRLENYLERYFTRYQDFYNDAGRSFEAKAIGPSAVQELAQRMKVNIQQAAVIILCDNYSRSNLPQSAAAKTKLQSWAEYLYIHLNPTIFPSPEQQRYEQQMMHAAEDTARELWQAFKAFNQDPLDWGNQYARQEALRVYEELERAGDAAHHIWLQRHQPDRVPPPTAIAPLRPQAVEFLFIPRSPKSTQSQAKVEDVTEKDSASDRGSKSCSSSSAESSASDTPSVSSIEDMDLIQFSDYPLKEAIPRTVEGWTRTPRRERSLSDPLPPDLDDGTPESPSGPQVPKDLSLIDEERSNDVKIAALSGAGTASNSPNTSSEQHGFNRTIMLFSATRKCLPVKALLDTGNEGPNWVSLEIVMQLDMRHELYKFQKSAEIPQWKDANGHCLRALGIVKLSWQHWDPHQLQMYTKWEEEEFHVLPASSNHIQVIFGAPFLLKHNLVQFNQHAVIPLTADRKLNHSVKRQMEDNIKARDKKKRESEAERIRLEYLQDAKPTNHSKGTKKAKGG